MSGITGEPENATFTLVVNEEHVALTAEDRERITKAIQEIAGSKLQTKDKGAGKVTFMTWDRVASEVIDAHERFQLTAITSVAADMAHRS